VSPRGAGVTLACAFGRCRYERSREVVDSLDEPRPEPPVGARSAEELAVIALGRDNVAMDRGNAERSMSSSRARHGGRDCEERAVPENEEDPAEAGPLLRAVRSLTPGSAAANSYLTAAHGRWTWQPWLPCARVGELEFALLTVLAWSVPRLQAAAGSSVAGSASAVPASVARRVRLRERAAMIRRTGVSF